MHELYRSIIKFESAEKKFGRGAAGRHETTGNETHEQLLIILEHAL